MRNKVSGWSEIPAPAELVESWEFRAALRRYAVRRYVVRRYAVRRFLVSLSAFLLIYLWHKTANRLFLLFKVRSFAPDNIMIGQRWSANAIRNAHARDT